MNDFVREYARVQIRLKQAREMQIQILGHSKDSLRELERQATIQMGEQTLVSTEYGIVQKIVDKPIQYYQLHSADPNKQIWGNKLQLITERK